MPFKIGDIVETTVDQFFLGYNYFELKSKTRGKIVSDIDIMENCVKVLFHGQERSFYIKKDNLKLLERENG